jgi:hypothetical protein
VERIDGVPAAGFTTQGRSGWGRRCGLWAAWPTSPRRWPRGASPRSGVAPAGRASHARPPGGSGTPPLGTSDRAQGALLEGYTPGKPEQSAREARTRGQKTPQVERREASIPIARDAPRPQAWLLGRLSALRSPRCGEAETRQDRRTVAEKTKKKKRAAERWLFTLSVMPGLDPGIHRNKVRGFR